MDGIIDYNTTDPSVYRKCIEIMVKPQVTKLKNLAVSFRCFLMVMISHTRTMEWINFCYFTVNTVTVNLFKTFALVPLEMIVNRMNQMRIAATISTATT